MSPSSSSSSSATHSQSATKKKKTPRSSKKQQQETAEKDVANTPAKTLSNALLTRLSSKRNVEFENANKSTKTPAKQKNQLSGVQTAEIDVSYFGDVVDCTDNCVLVLVILI